MSDILNPSSDKSSADFDLSGYSVTQLRSLLVDVNASMISRRAKEITELQIKIRAMVGESGYSLMDIVGPLLKSGNRPTASTMYRHPDQPELVWTGRGKRPAWLKDWLSQGGSLENLQVI